jgi:ATP-dependent RNA helicase DDX24/MAK5
MAKPEQPTLSKKEGLKNW